MVKKDDDKTELLAHKGGDFREMQMSILTDRSLDTLGVLERSVEVQLRSRAMTREKGVAFDDGVEHRLLIVRGILAEVREHIRVGNAEAAANEAARAAHLLCELDHVERSEDVSKAIAESIRLQAQEKSK